MKARRHQFKTEVAQLLDLVVHSLYSKKEIFLRELISNASDAIDRARYEALTDQSLVEDAPEWKITLFADKDTKTLRVEDNGIGMNAEEIERNLGTIAGSGTRAYLEALRASSEAGTASPDLIGRFGVGFYSAFMVADEVIVDSLRRGKDSEPVRWSSRGDGAYRIEAGDRAEPGTCITLKMREDQTGRLDRWEIGRIVRHYSDYIAYPIFLTVRENGKDTRSEEPLNSTKAIWKRPRNEIKDEEYNAFFKHLSHSSEDPLRVIHLSVEGQLEFRALMFLPPRAPFDMFFPEAEKGLHLYVRNVFIGSNFKDLLPDYLGFVRGVVDSSDLPLNVSREMLQDHAVIRKIRVNLVSRILAELKDLMEKDRETYEGFFREFGRFLKEGVHSDRENAEKLKELLLFPSLKSGEKGLISLREYREAMPSSQPHMYYLAAEDNRIAAQSPHLELPRREGYDVLFFTDPVDEWIAGDIAEFDGMALRPLHKGTVDLPESGKADPEREQREKEGAPLAERIRKSLGDRVGEVRVSRRLTDSPCCLVSEEHGMSPGMERMLRAMRQPLPPQKRILEINPDHPLLLRMEKMPEDGPFGEYAELLYQVALLAEGSPVDDPAGLSRKLAELMLKA